MVDQALAELRSRLDKLAIKAQGGGKKQGKFGITEPISDISMNIIHCNKYMRVLKYNLTFRSGKVFRFLVADSDKTKKRIEKDNEDFQFMHIIVVHSNEYIQSLVNRIGNCIRTFFSKIKRRQERRDQRLNLRTHSAQQYCPC
jgi:broad-specificity NMP kinase